MGTFRLAIRTGFLFPFACALVHASTFTTLYNFAGSPNDGDAPQSLVMGANGVLYGTTNDGGDVSCNGGCGAVFSLTPPVAPGGAWTEGVYLFPGTHENTKGSYPGPGLAIGNQGALYGVTTEGGYANNGTVFALSSVSGITKEDVIHRFHASDGTEPIGVPVFGSDGVIYGTAAYGGAHHYGTVYSLTPPAVPGSNWSVAVLHNFSINEGTYPHAGVVIDSGGVLYGTTLGGPRNNGTVYSLSPPAVSGGPWTETILYTFTGGSDGGNPTAGSLVIGSGGVLYGMTMNGGAAGAGTVFALTPPTTPGGPWVQTVLYSFGSSPVDGGAPEAGLTLGPGEVLYGTTIGGGTSLVYGTVFSLTPPIVPGGPWTENIIYSFTGRDDGAAPWGTLVLDGATLYGTTSMGGSLGHGTVFSLTP